MCTAFSRLQGLNLCKMPPDEVKRIIKYAAKNLECMELCRIQMDQGLYFLFELQLSASSWKSPEVHDVLKRRGVVRVEGHMCQFGMKQSDDQGVVWIKKPTGFMTNSKCIADRLSRVCKPRCIQMAVAERSSKEYCIIWRWTEG